MDNKTVLSEHKFILQDDGKIYLMDGDSAIEVSNQKDVFAAMAWKGLTPLFNEPYSLLCSVEKGDNPLNRCEPCNNLGVSHCAHPNECNQIAIGPVALVTFSKPEEKETQEELETAHWVRIINDARFYDGSPHDMIRLIGHFKKLGYTITRKK